MLIPIFLIIHWYASLFFQSFFHHRYAAHNHFTMSKAWEKFFYICCFLTQGSSYISARAYGLMHRLHHAHTDTVNDPHSPSFFQSIPALLWKTRNSYNDIFKGYTIVEEKYSKDLPEWQSFDKFAHNWLARVLWGVLYTAIYAVFVTHWWMWLFLPLTFSMGALQGIAVNWWAHRFGYRNYALRNTSRNILPLDLLFWGEAYHNNHHKNPGRANNAVKWFELDTGYAVIKLMHRLKIIKLKAMR
ncbi:fatty acid desaturase [Pedobacter kyungheensis]|uniref:Fatty acid desaturase n=1 Tax=Pedobacter kyungheensis TaxID=1069985 RepID=A0A0C1FTQ4_9SPHI|nr:acyl-CoA desaturase [Pedobacter kyungheensis]KIA95178.1 fatty acid desaturase [Pedobacter kyungheensis]